MPIMAPNHPLQESDIRAMVRLLGEVAGLNGSRLEKKRLLMDGLCRLIDSDFWAWALCEPTAHGETPVYSHFQHGGFSPDRYTRYREAIDHPRIGEIAMPFESELEQKRTHLTRTLEQIDPTNLLNRSEVGPLFDAAGIGPIMLSFRPLENGARSGIGLYRHTGRQEFDTRETRIAHIMLAEVPWLHFPAHTGKPADAVPPRLTQRQRAVMELLVKGLDRKNIASHLSLSEHTVKDYVTSVYRHFDVTGQTELIRRLTRGDGGDIA